ncbi:uncharacterized protein N7469_008742 [Penicillium citrinum]|uniref:MARVEL domain-containing protein n=2 Tax=Penicillium TaxID=5073 RepID=A0A9W9NM43_PENCI|nr:uncharacterized protein N7469_008742 [Penicillium citrinum]KAJ5222502.1 hypothetical protein N7469_008742 [Penicillium citrinum]KAJ5580659.1 hypothetical protein N7450_006960 [Penicillium hetheringtonii]KAK5788710.1 hypothetical protein VI817_009668 [Penicillium citrinum]
MLSWVYPLRIVQAIFALATIGLSAYVIGTLYDSWSFSNVIYFMLFNGCWTTVVAVPYLGLAPLWLPRISHEYVIPFVEIVTMCLWLSGWIALAALIPKPSACTYPSCHGLQALIVVAAVEWALFVFTNFFAIVDLKNSRQNSKNHQNGQQQEQAQPPVSEVTSASEEV